MPDRNDMTVQTRLNVVPDQQHYTGSYLGPDLMRLYSYRAQAAYALRSHPATALVVGKGDGIVHDLLSRNGVRATTLDIQKDLAPDVVGSVDAMPLAAKSYDVTLCCQVLEHLPFDCLVPSLTELARVTRDRVILSLPDIRRFISLRLQFGKRRLDWQMALPRLQPPKLPRERLEVHGHYWEIGFEGTAFHDIYRAIHLSGLEVLEHRRVSDLPWHTFFYLSPSPSD